MNAPENLAITEPRMNHRKDDDPPYGNPLRVIDWKWLAGMLVAFVIWAANQWVQYNELIKGYVAQGVLINTLTTNIGNMDSKISDFRFENLKQDGEITRIKDKLVIIEAALVAVKVKP